MKKLILLIGTVALAAATPAAAKPDQGHGKGKHSQMKKGSSHQAGRSNQRAATSDRHGRLFAFNARGTCPPGLAKKSNGCTPPGQAKKLYNVGQRYNRNSGNSWSYDQIPGDLRSQYDLNQNNRYYYNNGYLYQVNPETMLVQRAISALLR